MGSNSLQRFRSSADGKIITLTVNTWDNSILWRHILKSFGDVTKVCVNDTDIHFMLDDHYEDLLPLRIHARPDSTIDVILPKDLTQKNNKMADLPPKYNEELRHIERVRSIVLPFTYHINQPGDEYVRFGSRISLQHVRTGCYLHSADWAYKKQKFGDSLKKYAVQGVRSGEPGLKDFWQVVPAYRSVDKINEKIEETVRYGTRIRLFNVANKRWLNCHEDTMEVIMKFSDNDLLVTTFGSESKPNEGDIWIVERLENGTDYWKASDIFLLRQENNDVYLHSDNTLYKGEIKVNCTTKNVLINNLWRAGLV
ncbi:hypothetical protein BGZ76_009922 [Entomortierella beljakovae]|nr:hypothetical protein BGZ76_009922 [Entomortierella beljakovae]